MRKGAIIGIGGRIGSMFFHELKDTFELVGFARENEIMEIKASKIYIKKGEEDFPLSGDFFKDYEFPANREFDFLILCTKNPIDLPLQFYLKRIKEKGMKIPILFLPQNGIEAGDTALSLSQKIFGETPNIFRIALFNPVARYEQGNKIFIQYSLPIKLAVTKFSGNVSEGDIFIAFKKKDFIVFEVPSCNAKRMEYSKLVLNLLGMASAVNGLSLSEGFARKDIFKMEIEVLREFKKIVKHLREGFLNFPGYPVALLMTTVSLPLFLLFPLRNIFGKMIERKREFKAKDLDELDFYNGAIVRLGERLGILTPQNEYILKKYKLSCSLKE